MLKKQLIIIGLGGHGKVVADIAYKMDNWEEIVFLDDAIDRIFDPRFKVIGKIDDAIKYNDYADFVVAIGDNTTRQIVQERLDVLNCKLATIIHPSSIIGTDVLINVGSVIMGGVVINSSARIGKGCIINTSSSVDHDSIIGDYVHISPGSHLGGGVIIGKKSWLGIGSTVINSITICDNCLIGAGSVVINNLDKSGIYVGVPAEYKKSYD